MTKILPVVCMAALLTAWRCQPALAVTVTYSGYIVDDLCFDKCESSPGCDDCALDKTNVLLRPQTHTVHCIRDVQVCIDSGYGLMANVGTSSNPDYQYKFKLDSAGNDRALEIIKATSLHEGLAITATGDDNGDGYLRSISAMSECTGGAALCDTVCTGCGVLPGPTTTSLQISIKPRLVVAHGSLLIIAWAFCAPTAALIKRHAGTIPSLNLTRKVFGFPLAFLLHVILMSCAATLTIIAVGIALGNFRGRAILGHGIIGGIVAILAILQPIEGFFFRPSHESPRRKYFNIIHHYTGGFLAVGLGMLNVVLGCVNYNTLWNNCKAPVFYGFALAGLGIALIVGLTLEWKARRGVWNKKNKKEEGASSHAGANPYSSKQTTKL